MAIEQKRMTQIVDSSENLLLYDPVLLEGELAIERDSGQMKLSTSGSANWSQLPYFNPATLTPNAITANTLNTSASLCGNLVRVQHAVSFTLTVLSGDLSKGTTPAGITSHFPEGGFFYVLFDHDVTAATTFTISAGPNNSIWANDYGVSSTVASSTSLNMNNGINCQGKLYLFICLPSGVWQVFELDTKDVWAQAKIALPTYPSYGGFARNRIISNGPPAGKRDIWFTDAFPSNAGVDTTNLATGRLIINTPGDYWIKGAATFVTAALTSPIFLRIRVNIDYPSTAFIEITGSPASPYTHVTVDTILRIEAADDIYLEFETSASESPIIQWAQLIVQKLDLKSNV